MLQNDYFVLPVHHESVKRYSQIADKLKISLTSQQSDSVDNCHCERVLEKLINRVKAIHVGEGKLL